MTDWKPGDLALCVKTAQNLIKKLGQIFTEDEETIRLLRGAPAEKKKEES